MQDQEQLRLSAEQCGLLWQQLSKAWASNTAAATVIPSITVMLSPHFTSPVIKSSHLRAQDEEQLRLSAEQCGLLRQQLGEAQASSTAAGRQTQEGRSQQPFFVIKTAQDHATCTHVFSVVQVAEQLRLSVEQCGLLRQQLAEVQASSTAAGRQAQDEQHELARLEQRVAALQGQADEQSGSARYD